MTKSNELSPQRAIPVACLLTLALLIVAPAARAGDLQLPAAIDTTLLNLASYRGEVVYLDFWASWCGPCKKSFPWMKEMHEKYRAKGLRVVAVDLDTNAKAAAEFLKATAPQFEIIHDTKGVLAMAFQVQVMPSSFLIDRAGRLRNSHLGFRQSEAAAVEKEIAELLAEGQAQKGGK